MAVEKGITERNGRYRAEAYDRETGRRRYRTFPTRTAARAWRRDMQVAIARGELRAVEPVTIREAYEQWLDKVESGQVRARGGQLYKPSVVHSYRLAFTSRLLDEFGRVKVGELRRKRVQDYVDQLVAEGLAAQTVRNTITALRVLMKYCVRAEYRRDNPCEGLELPSGGVARDRIVPAAEAVAILAGIADPVDRAIYATAFFAGLRRGELAALRNADLDIVNRTISVWDSYDFRTQSFGPPKSKAGTRTLGIPELLVPYLLVDGYPGPPSLRPDALVFGPDGTRPFHPGKLAERVGRPIGLHEARHTYASLMIAAGVNIKTISEWMGHSSVTITLDRYGHLLPGSAAAALGLLNDYLSGELGS